MTDNFTVYYIDNFDFQGTYFIFLKCAQFFQFVIQNWTDTISSHQDLQNTFEK